MVDLLEITVEAGPSGAVVRLSGESDITTAGQLRDALNAEVLAGARRIVVDLSGLRYADSSAIGVFIGVNRALAARGGTLELLGPQPHIASVFRLTGVDGVLTVRAGCGTEDPPAARLPAGQGGPARLAQSSIVCRWLLGQMPMVRS